MPDFYPSAFDDSKQVNFAGGNHAPIIFTSMPPEISLHQLPPVPRDFTGREGELAKLSALLDEAGWERAVLNLFGPPGVGKSALALAFAHRLVPTHRYPAAQLYVDATAPGGGLNAREVVAHLLAALGPDPAVDDSSVALHRIFNARLGNRTCLMVLDNVQRADQVRALVDNSPESVIIVTSRQPLASIDGVKLHKVATLEPSESAALLAAVSGRAPSELTPETAEAVAERCGNLPLAIKIAAATLKKRPHWTADHLLSELDSERTRLSALSIDDLDVRTSFDLSYDTLGGREQAAFRMSTLCPGPTFRPRETAELVECSEPEARTLLDSIADAQLLETEDGVRYRFHDLIALYAAAKRDRIDAPESTEAAAQRLLGSLSKEFTAAARKSASSGRWLFAEPLLVESELPRSRDFYMAQHLYSDALPGRLESWESIVAPGSRTLLFGGPGSGKTMLAEWTCGQIAGDRLGPWELGLSVPLRRFDPAETLEALISSVYESRTGVPAPGLVLHRVLSDQPVLVCFDSLDELPDQARRQAALRIERFAADHPQTTVMATSRFDPRLELTGFAVYHLAEPTPDAIETYLLSRIGNPRHVYALLEMLDESGLDRLRGNPLLLSWMVSAFQRFGSVPLTELGVQEAIFEMQMGQRDRRRALRRSDSFSPQTLIELTETIAHWFKSSPDRVFGAPEHRVRQFLAAELERRGSGTAREGLVDDLIAVLCEQNGILFEAGVDKDGHRVYSIIQDLFGEYLAARCLVASKDSAADLVDGITELVAAGRFDNGWRYTLTLAANRRPRLSMDLDHLKALLREAAEAYRGPGKEHVRSTLLP